MSRYADWFRTVTGFAPFPYQVRLGERDALPEILVAPTGSGKTAAVTLPWLWRRRSGDPGIRDRTPRRLVYVLPMRVLVDQVAERLRGWVARAGAGSEVGVHVLRGGAVDERWEGHPERDAVLVGTQDQLLSRALNRGYAMSRFRWPMHFGLLHNDAWWVLDEVQLMGPGLRTAAQLHGLRRRFGAYGPVGATFMSATLRPDWLRTPDFAPSGDAETLDDEDRAQPALRARTEASKPLARCPVEDARERSVAAWIASVHRPATLTLVVVNRVKRCAAIARALRRHTDAEVVVLHSRFRPAERAAAGAALAADPPDPGRIAVATQTVEAGVDLSAATLVTDLAPWPSLVQRFGRCNRRGEIDGARVFWIDVDTSKASAVAPYEAAELDAARERLQGLDDARIDGLPEVRAPWPTTDLPRASDVLDLFDTDPDLDGNDVDVSRWVRGAGGTDAAVYWREVRGDAPPADEPRPTPDELCPVPVRALADFVNKRARGRVWRWDPMDRRWVAAHTDGAGPAPGYVTAGARYLVAAEQGGYTVDYGWDGAARGDVPPVGGAGGPAEPAFDADPRSELRGYVALGVHLRDAWQEARDLTRAVGIVDPAHAAAVHRAAGWHDHGKIHPVFQEAAVGAEGLGAPVAKAPSFRRYARRGFRHELVSALAALAHGEPDLVAYLALAHHGKVRVGLRPLQWSDAPEGDRIRGVAADDAVGSVALPWGATRPLDGLPLDLAELGRGPSGPSWAERALGLLHELGPFRLAYLETLVRCADWRASARPSAVVGGGDA